MPDSRLEKAWDWVIYNPHKSLPLFVLIVVPLVLAGSDYLTYCYPPGWLVRAHRVNQQLQSQESPTARIVISSREAEAVYIPDTVTVTGGGEGVILEGPKYTIVSIHREVNGLDLERGLLWKWKY